MVGLILVVVSIALMSAAVTATISYMPVEATMRQELFKGVDRGIKSLECAVTRYLDANRGTDGNIIFPGAGVNLVASVTPTYGFLPAKVKKEFAWDVGTGVVSGMNAIGICVKPVTTSTALQKEVLNIVQTQLPVGSSFRGASCYSAVNDPTGGFLTYWIPLPHVN